MAQTVVQVTMRARFGQHLLGVLAGEGAVHLNLSGDDGVLLLDADGVAQLMSQDERGLGLHVQSAPEFPAHKAILRLALRAALPQGTPRDWIPRVAPLLVSGGARCSTAAEIDVGRKRTLAGH